MLPCKESAKLSGCVQDAREYFQHLLEVMSRSERSSMQRLGAADQPASADAFKFELEDRIQCLETGRVSYKRSLGNILAIDIPMDAATNKDELEDYQVLQSTHRCAQVGQTISASHPVWDSILEHKGKLDNLVQLHVQ